MSIVSFRNSTQIFLLSSWSASREQSQLPTDLESTVLSLAILKLQSPYVCKILEILHVVVLLATSFHSAKISYTGKRT
jgi:hypothetical protein